MSQYLSSIFIDPIVRQARRFSRPSHDSELPHSSIRQLSRGSNRTPSNEDASTAVTTGHDDQFHLVLEDVEPSLDINDDLDVLSTQSGRRLEAELRPWGVREGTPPPSRHIEFGPEVYMRTRPARGYNEQPGDDTSDNPLYGIPQSLRSRDSSFSNSIISGIDSDLPSAEVLSLASGLNRDRGGGSYSNRIGGKSLPADDGRSYMRKKILAIQGSNATSAEKARLIHTLMTEKYTLSQSNFRASQHTRPLSPSSLLSHEQPYTPPSVLSMDDPILVTSPTTSLGTSYTNPFHLSPDDLKPTHYSKPEKASELGNIRNSGSSDSLDEERVLGCPHYKRNVKLQCSACDRWYTCRFCHDDAEDHMLNRRETRHMLCMLCGYAQAAAELCRGCGESAARYYCDVCKLWDDDPQKSIYHCNDCGICRVGQGLGKDFFHCEVCSVCVSMAVKDSHRCIERSTECDCPICGEYMFNSPRTVVFMRCGHSIHQRCYYEHMNTSYRCPICSRSVINMDVQFRHLERAIESQPMPPQFQDTKVRVYCNDCTAKTTVKYHWLGLKCAVCDSFNTAQIQILRGPAETILPPSRGRAPETTQPPLRPAISSSALNLSRTQPYTLLPRRNARSESPSTNTHLLLSTSSSSTATDSIDTTDEEDDDEDDDDDDDDDVEFWGGESPNNRPRHSLPNSQTERNGIGQQQPIIRESVHTHTHTHTHTHNDKDEANDHDNHDHDDESMSDSDSIDEDGEDDGDGEGDEESDRMEIFGHR